MEITDKAELRKIYKEIRKHIRDRERKEKAIEDRLLRIIGTAKKVFCYESLPSEVSTVGIIARASEFAKIYVPEVDGANMFLRSLVSGETDNIDCDVTIVPLIAFDETLFRIGFGGGYYDRFLATHTSRSIGIAFDEQQCDIFEHDAYDVPLDTIVTPTRILRIT